MRRRRPSSRPPYAKGEQGWRPNRIMLFDGNNLAWKSLYGGSLLTDADQNNVSLIYRFIRTIHAVLFRFPRYIPIVVWDKGKSVLKTKLYPEYKAHRRGRAETHSKLGREEEAIDWHYEFKRQTRILRGEVFPLLGIPSISVEGVEADDIIFYLTRFYHQRRDLVGVCSSDKDLYQCVSRGVFVFDHTSKLMINTKGFEHITKGLNSNQYVMYRAMRGDPSDNIKGIKGIGEVKARQICLDISTITTPKQFLEADLKEKLALKLQADLADNPKLYKDFKVSYQLTSLKHWYFVYRKKLQALKVGHPVRFVKTFSSFSSIEFEKWALQRKMHTLVYGETAITNCLLNRRNQWRMFLEKASVLKHVPKDKRV